MEGCGRKGPVATVTLTACLKETSLLCRNDTCPPEGPSGEDRSPWGNPGTFQQVALQSLFPFGRWKKTRGWGREVTCSRSHLLTRGRARRRTLFRRLDQKKPGLLGDRSLCSREAQSLRKGALAVHGEGPWGGCRLERVADPQPSASQKPPCVCKALGANPQGGGKNWGFTCPRAVGTSWGAGASREVLITASSNCWGKQLQCKERN